MTVNDKNLAIATFRFGVISDFVTGVHLNYGDRANLLKEKASRKYKIPFSNNSNLSVSTIKKWILDYKKAGNRLEGLMPASRKDKGKYKTLDSSIQMAIREIKEKKPHLTGIALIGELQHRKYIGVTESLNLTVLYRFLKQEKLQRPSTTNKDRRAFEASSPNEIWQSDVMHGPYIKIANKNKKTYLIAVIDDHSRMIIHAEFYLSEKLIDLKDCLRQSIQKRGLPQKIYIDNGSCYRALNVEQIAALLGIGITHTPPYTPQGRGKIERWFRYVRESFLAINDKFSSLEELNELFENWVAEYNNKKHSTTKEKPLERFKKGIKCIRPAPKNLIDYFRIIEHRRVKKDRTIQLNSKLYEVAVELVDLKIEARYHHESPEEIEIYFDGRNYGTAVPLNRELNGKIGRKTGELINNVSAGELFK